MANTPSFIAKQGTRVSTSGTLEFTAKQDSKIYHALCKNSTATTPDAKLEITTSQDVDEEITNPILKKSVRWKNNGVVPNNDLNYNQYYEGFSHLLYTNIDEISLTIPGTFPLTQNTTFNLSLVIRTPDGDSTANVNLSFASGATLENVAHRIFNRLLFNYANYSGSAYNRPINVSYIFNGGQRVITRDLELDNYVYEITQQFTDNGLLPVEFTSTISGNTVTISQNTRAVDGKSIPVNDRYSYLRNSFEETGFYQVFNASHDFNADNTFYEEYNGEAGTEADPMPLLLDAESQLNGIISSDSPIEMFTKDIEITNIKAVTTGGTLPVVSDHTFTATGQDIDLVSDSSVNSLILRDVHGNTYLPLEKGQKLKITAPVTNIALIYGEE